MEINAYGRQLSSTDIQAGAHRDFVGGLWDQVGTLQFDFLVKQGLEPHHRFLDMGCGAMRGGVHFVRYLNAGHYYGLDFNASLLEAGQHELSKAGLLSKKPQLLVDDQFDVGRFATKFEYALALSLFTHLPMNHIVRCLVEVGRSLATGGCLFATFFEAPQSAHLNALAHSPGGIVTQYDRDPYHQSVEEMRWLANAAGLRLAHVEEWGHPRGQKILKFFAQSS